MDKIKISEHLDTSSTTQTSALSYSNIPFEFSGWRSGVITGEFKNFGNLDNEVKITVLWGESEEGEFPFEHGSNPALSTLRWKEDNTLIHQVFCGDAVEDVVKIRINIHEVRSNFMKLQYELTGTDIQFNDELYFRGGSLW